MAALNGEEIFFFLRRMNDRSMNALKIKWHWSGSLEHYLVDIKLKFLFFFPHREGKINGMKRN